VVDTKILPSTQAFRGGSATAQCSESHWKKKRGAHRIPCSWQIPCDTHTHTHTAMNVRHSLCWECAWVDHVMLTDRACRCPITPTRTLCKHPSSAILVFILIACCSRSVYLQPGWCQSFCRCMLSFAQVRESVTVALCSCDACVHPESHTFANHRSLPESTSKLQARHRTRRPRSICRRSSCMPKH
jgi:hypothetical protein